MDIKLFSFSKRTNSTKRPVMATGRNFSCTLNENTSMESPVINIKAPLDLDGIVEKTYPASSLPSAPLNITDGAQDKPFTAMNIKMDPIQAAGTPSPSNPLPISGRSAVAIGNANDNTHNVTIQLGRTVYGGTLDVVSGVLTVTHEVVTYTGANEESWTLSQTGGIYRFYTTLNDAKVNSSGRTSVYCNIGAFSSSGNAEYSVFLSNIKQLFYIPTQTVTTVADFKTWLSTNNLQVVYELATPQTYQLTPQEVLLVQGNNLLDLSDEGCAYISPIRYYGLQAGLGHMYDFNYAYIPDLKRYYYIGNRVYSLGLWTMELRLDVLATHKNAIGASTHYIERCSYESNPYVIDSIYPLQTNQTLTIQKPEKVGEYYPSIFGTTITPSYVVGIIGGIDSTWAATLQAAGDIYNGSVVYFLLTEAQMGKFITSLMENVDLYDIPVSELSKNLQKQLINPIQYIHSISCVPFYPAPLDYYYVKSYQLGFTYVDVPDRATESWRILPAPTVGGNTTDNGYMVKNQCDIRMPLHPSYTDKGHWVLSDPYSKYVLHVGPYGEIQIPSGEIMRATVHGSGDSAYLQLYITTVFDISTGECTLFLAFDSTSCDDAFLEVTKNLSIPIPVHQAMQDVASHRQARRDLAYQQIGAVMDIAKSVVGFTGGGTSVSGGETVTDMGGESITVGEGRLGRANIGGSGPISTALNAQAKMMNTIDSATRANQVTISGNGNEGSYMSFNQDLCTPRMFCYFSPFVEEYNEEKGRPLCKVKQISTIPGYIQCSGAEIETYGVVSENEAIASFLNGGFYYE